MSQEFLDQRLQHASNIVRLDALDQRMKHLEEDIAEIKQAAKDTNTEVKILSTAFIESRATLKGVYLAVAVVGTLAVGLVGWLLGLLRVPVR